MTSMRKILVAVLALLTIMSSCENLDIESTLSTEDKQMKFKVFAPGAETKVTGTTFEINDKIGLYVTDYLDEETPMPLQISGNRANNVILESYEGYLWKTVKPIYWGDCYSDVYAYYPYCAEITDITNQYFEISTDQSTQRDGDILGGYEASDLLWAKATKVKSDNENVTLAFKHILSKLTIKIVKGENYQGDLPSIDNTSVYLHNSITAARIDFQTGSVEKDLYTGSKSIRMKGVGLDKYNTADAIVYEAIVIPQMINSIVPFIEIETNGISYLIEDIFNFRPGTAYTYVVTLNTSSTSIKVEIGSEIEGWE